MSRPSLEKKKISFNIPIALLKEIEEYCTANTLPFTQGVHILMRYGLDYVSALKSIPEFLQATNTLKSLAAKKKKNVNRF